MKIMRFKVLINKFFDKKKIIFLFLIVLLVFNILFFCHTYIGYNWIPETGFGKYYITKFDNYQKIIEIEQYQRTVWDWLDLLIIPCALVGFAAWLNKSENRRNKKEELVNQRTQLNIEDDRFSEKALQKYFDDLNNLLLSSEKPLLDSKKDSPERFSARLLTINTLRYLARNEQNDEYPSKFKRRDDERQVLLIRFINEAGLISKKDPIISLVSANLQNVNFYDMHLSKVNFDSVKFDGADFSEASIIESSITNGEFRETIFTLTDFTKSNLSNGKFFVAEFKKTKFIDSKIKNGDFTKAIFENVKFMNSKIDNSIFINCTISNTNFNLASITFADFSNATLSNCDFSGANLSNSTFKNCEICNSVFTNTNLTNCDFGNAKIHKSIFPSEKQ